MSEAVQEKSRGLKFAEQQLLRHGWEHGKGLGRAEDGISEAIRVKVKCDKGGVGHRAGEEFSFHWWDHVFNQASSSLQVESQQDGIQLKKTEGGEVGEGSMVSNKKPRKALLEKSKLYDRFVKSATLQGGQELKEAGSSSSSSEDEEESVDMSSTVGLSDRQLMKACGGRTAHKGARHGLTMSAKLARLEQQEAEFLARQATAGQSESCSSLRDEETRSDEVTRKKKKCRGEGELMCEENTKKQKNKEGGDLNDQSQPEEEEEERRRRRKKKKKKKRKSQPEEQEEMTVKTKRKNKQ